MAIQTPDLNANLSFSPDLVVADVKFSPYSLGLAHTATTGWQSAGTLTPASDQSTSVTFDVVSVDTGSPITTKKDLVERINGEFSFLITDLNPKSLELASGTTLTTTANDTSGGATGTVDASSTASAIVVGSGEATGFTANDWIRVTHGSGTSASTSYNEIASVDTATETLTLKYPFKEGAPTTGTQVVEIDGVTNHQGGNSIEEYAMLVKLDFPDSGQQHIQKLHKCSVTGGTARTYDGAVKTPISGKLYGFTVNHDGKDQVIPMTTYITGPNAA